MLGRSSRAICLAGFQRSDRTRARAQWMNASITVTTMTLFGAFSSTTNRASSSGSTDRRALPFTRGVSFTPGTMKSNPSR